MAQNTRRKPKITVSDHDYEQLSAFAGAAPERWADAADELLSELDRARVVPARRMPADVVAMGSTVEFRSDAGEARRVTLVFPGDADIAEGRVSILTPVGTALLGLAPGQSISWTARDGRRHALTVVSVEPPAAGTPGKAARTGAASA
ncbi:nucleoside diphosphate kinase regulator [Kaustia mangrovi]|uniref:Nucleoside diphosphate kinase regulator n=1 Tax=Kaustia mangrovi TaxID=2593653 RepID=A0A7S8C557_9HYPH|nr:nucleoside diphosphate kinase regulator [Kaustia mangrovi]QPC43548.1 nucleoside diphosphate kinase regulator [Kaustia mangrovi]